MGIVSSLFAKPISRALTKSVVKQSDRVVPAPVSDVVAPVADEVPVPSKALVSRKPKSVSKAVVKEEAAPVQDVELNTDPLFKYEEPVDVAAPFVARKVDRTEDFGVEPELIADKGTDAFKALDLSADKKEAWRKQNKASQRSRLLPEIEEAAQKLFDGTLKPEEFRKLSAEKQPIVPLDKVPDMPSFKDIAGALTPEQVNKGIVGLNMKIAPGERVSSRLDIPAYNDYNTWVVSLHEGTTKSGAPIGYAKTAVLKNVEFMSDPKVALDIARRKPLVSGKRMGKATIARIFGDYVPHNPDNAKAYAEKIFNDPEWTQVGMNPYRASYFYDKADNMPVISADEIVQIGPLVMARNVKKTKPDDALFKVNKKDDASPTFAKGGVVKNEMNKLFAEGGVMQEGGTVDPVSGNDVPVGSLQEEVRDDIPAQLSEGEFVFPADVVRFYGLEKLMMMRDKAKKGLQKMNDIGQMGNAEEVEDADSLFGGGDMDDDTFSSEIDSIIGETDAESMGGTREFNVGGLATPGTDYLAKYNIPRSAITNPALDVRAYKNADGRLMYITFFNGKPSTPIPEGFDFVGTGQEMQATLKKQEEKPKDVVTATDTTTQDSGGGDGVDSSPTGQPATSKATPTSYADLSLPSTVTGGKGKAVNVAGSLVGGMLFGPIGASLGAKASNIMNFLSTQSAEGAWGDFVGSNLNSIGYSPEAVTAAKDAMNAAMGVQGATKSDVAAAGANAASKVDMVDPLQALLDATDNFGTTLGDDTLSAAVEAAPAAEAEAGFEAPSMDAGQPDYGDAPVFAKGGLVKKRINKKTGKSTSFVTRQK